MAGADVLQRVDADPDHALLHGEDGDLDEAALLAAAGAAAAGEGGGDLVAPALGLVLRDGPVHQVFHLGRDAAEVGRAAEDDGIIAVELVDARLGLGDRDQGGRRATDRAGALADALGDHLGVVQPAVIEHGDTEFAHDRGTPLRPRPRRRPAPR